MNPPAVHAGHGPVDVRHGDQLSRRALGDAGVRPGPERNPDRVRGGESSRGRATGVPFFGAPGGAPVVRNLSLHRDSGDASFMRVARAMNLDHARTPARALPSVTSNLSQWPPRLGVARREHGAPARTRVLGRAPRPTGRGSVPDAAVAGEASARDRRSPAGVTGGSCPHAPTGPYRGRPSRCPPRRPRDAAATQRERQFAAFVATVDLAIAERVDWSSSPATCSTTTSSRAGRWSGSPTCSLRLRPGPDPDGAHPGTHDVYDRSSVYRAYDLVALAGSRRGTALSPS
jgi:hypothetical protein